MANLGGRVVACLEARHAAEMADLVARHRGVTYPAPCLREVHEPDAAETRLAVDLLGGRQVDVAVFLTGVGAKTILEGARHAGRLGELLAGLAAMRVAARGPKTQNALRRVGVRVDLLAATPFTSQRLLEVMAAEWDLRSQRVLVQLYGGPVPAFTDGLSALGAQVRQVAPYRWERPLDEDAVVRLIEDLGAGWVDVLAATSAVQVEHLFAIARDRGCEADLRRAFAAPKPLVAAQGVVCAAAFAKEGVGVDLVSPRTSMGSLVLAIADRVGPTRKAEGADPTLPLDGLVAVVPAGGGVDLGAARAALAGVAPTATVALLAGRQRKLERAVADAAIARGLAVRTVPPARDGRHPADDLVRRADHVLVLAGGAGTGRVVQLAERYAKPLRVVRADGSPAAA